MGEGKGGREGRIAGVEELGAGVCTYNKVPSIFVLHSSVSAQSPVVLFLCCFALQASQ